MTCHDVGSHGQTPTLLRVSSNWAKHGIVERAAAHKRQPAFCETTSCAVLACFEGQRSMSNDEPVSEVAVKTAIQKRADYLVANLA